MRENPDNNNGSILLVLTVLFLAAVGYLRIWTIHGTMWDDNAWLMSIYSTSSLRGFLNTGFFEARRVPLGVFLYGLFWLHKNTGMYFVAWHGLNMLTQFLTPFLIYLAFRKMFSESRMLAFLVAASFAAISLDQTLPYAAAINYRIGLLLGVFSFYLTVCALMSQRYRVVFSLASMAAAFVAYTVFIEAVVALELGRFVMVLLVLRRQQTSGRLNLFMTGLKWWFPYIALCIPYAVYKLVDKPYGIYTGVYVSNIFFWLNWQDDINLLAYLFLFQWVIFLGYIKHAAISSMLLGIGAVAVVATLFVKLETRNIDGPIKSPEGIKDQRKLVKETLILGLALLIPSVLLFQFAGRPVTWGIYSSHGTIGQFGYAVIIGSLLTAAYSATGIHSRWRSVVRVGVPLFFGAGVFFNNLNIDLYNYSHQQESAFWQAFLRRFPTLPEKAVFLFDVKNESLYHPKYFYDYELPLNLLYAPDSSPATFRRYRVYTAFELHIVNHLIDPVHLAETYIKRHTWWGEDKLYPSKFIAVQYDGKHLLVNKEIVEAHPGTPYRALLDKAVPVWPAQKRQYPLRSKVLRTD